MRNSRLALAALHCGVLSIVGLVVGVVANQPIWLAVFAGGGVAALLLGIAGLCVISREGSQLSGRGFAWWGMGLPVVTLILGALFVPAT